MKLFLVTEKQLLESRNSIVMNQAIPELLSQGFIQSPFSTAWFGKNNLGDYTYELCRLAADGFLEMIVIHISKGDIWIKIILNVFELSPTPENLEELEGFDGLKYHLPPNSISNLYLRRDEYRGLPLFIMIFRPHYKLSRFKSLKDLKESSRRLGSLVSEDMKNIDDFVGKWKKLYQPNQVNWNGDVLKSH